MRNRKEHSPISATDKAFFHQFYEENKKFMYYIARQYTTTAADCEDVVQDATMRLLNNISSLREINRCKTAKYIELTIKSAYLDSEKHKQKERVVFLDDDTLEALLIERITRLNSDQELSNNLAIAKLKAELPARDWAVLEGKYILGYPQEELGRIYGVAPDSIRMVLHRAREKAKKILDQDTAEEGD